MHPGRYIEPMMTYRQFLGMTVLGVSLAVGTGFAFAGWLDHGGRILLSMAETGLAWCF